VFFEPVTLGPAFRYMSAVAVAKIIREKADSEAVLKGKYVPPPGQNSRGPAHEAFFVRHRTAQQITRICHEVSMSEDMEWNPAAPSSLLIWLKEIIAEYRALVSGVSPFAVAQEVAKRDAFDQVGVAIATIGGRGPRGGWRAADEKDSGNGRRRGRRSGSRSASAGGGGGRGGGGDGNRRAITNGGDGSGGGSASGNGSRGRGSNTTTA
jgi:hypothetical protein